MREAVFAVRRLAVLVGDEPRRGRSAFPTTMLVRCTMYVFRRTECIGAAMMVPPHSSICGPIDRQYAPGKPRRVVSARTHLASLQFACRERKGVCKCAFRAFDPRTIRMYAELMPNQTQARRNRKTYSREKRFCGTLGTELTTYPSEGVEVPN